MDGHFLTMDRQFYRRFNTEPNLVPFSADSGDGYRDIIPDHNSVVCLSAEYKHVYSP